MTDSIKQPGQAGTENEIEITCEMISAGARALVASGRVRWNLPDWEAREVSREILEAAFSARLSQSLS